MKNILIFIFLFAVLENHAQTTTKNFVKETTRRTASVGSLPVVGGTNNNIVTTTYYDGLGRPVQVVDQNSSTDDSKNIVTHIEYEKNIGQTKQYLPFISTGYTSTSTGGSFPIVTTTYHSNFVEGAKDQTLAFYETYNEYTLNPYSETRKEASPRQRVVETGFPGTDWNINLDGGYTPEGLRNTVRSSYALNTAGEVKRYSVSTAFSDGTYKNSIADNGFYPENTLTKTRVKNENWKEGDGNNNTVEEFKDQKGNVVLKRSYNNGEAHDTYYAYNAHDLLAFVIPPMAEGSTLGSHLDKWCYQYHYDARKRLVEKKLPQKEWEYTVYDKMDRVVMSGPVPNPFGDGTKGWMLTKYDAFGRIVYTGYYAADSFGSAARNALAQNSFVPESKSAGDNTIDGIWANYTNNSFPTNFKLLSVTYYDNYTYPNAPTSFPTIEAQAANTAVKGQVTGSWMRTLTTAANTAGTLSYNLYDDKYRTIRSYSSNHLGGYTQTDSKLSFTGVPVKTVTYQKYNGSAAVLTITDNFTYDRRDRLTRHTQQIGSAAVETIAANTYDVLGVLTTKNVGGASGNLQKVDYKYNIRGWLTDINNADMDFIDGENDLFQFKINYNRYAIQNKNQFNGNISSVWSRTKVDNSFRGYVYWYDHLNRLTQAKNMYYHKPGGWLMGQYMDDSYGEALTYDKNGNIATLNRTGQLIGGQPVGIDALSYSYDANQLQNVSDATNHPDGFRDGNTTGTDYVYDSLGNITQDLNKGITAVTYNHLNLPYNVQFANGGSINYTYDALGTRLSKKVQPSGGALVTTDYVNGFQYENNVLQFFPHAEGYVKDKGNNTYLYVYQYKDHLGNIRLSYADVSGDGTIQPASEILEENNYYPFGLKHKGYNEVVNSNRSEAAEKYKFGGKELNDELGLDLYDFGARNYDPSIGRWLNIDPLAENSRRWTPYNYAYNNPIIFVDPDGMQAFLPGSYGQNLNSSAINMFYFGEDSFTGEDDTVKGVNKESAQKLHSDMNTAFANKRFDSFRSLLTRGKKNNNTTFDKIGEDAFKNATSSLTGDDLIAATSVYNAINSSSEFVFEYMSGNTMTDAGNAAYKYNFNDNSNNVYTTEDIIAAGGEGLTVSSPKGAHAFIVDQANTQHLEGQRTLTTFHEGLGHGIPIIRGVKGDNNNFNSIRYENMIRRIMNIQTMRDGTNPIHGGGQRVPNHLGTPLY